MSRIDEYFLEIPSKEAPSVIVPQVKGASNIFLLKTRDSYLELLEALENWVKNNQRTTEKQYLDMIEYKLGYSLNDTNMSKIVPQSFHTKEIQSRSHTLDSNKFGASYRNPKDPSDISVRHTDLLISYLEESLLSTSKRPHEHKMGSFSRQSSINNISKTKFETPMKDNLLKKSFLKTPDKPRYSANNNLSSKQSSPSRICPSTVNRFKNAGTKPSTRKQRVTYINYSSPERKELKIDHIKHNINRLKSPIQVKRYNMYEGFLFTGIIFNIKKNRR